MAGQKQIIPQLDFSTTYFKELEKKNDLFNNFKKFMEQQSHSENEISINCYNFLYELVSNQIQGSFSNPETVITFFQQILTSFSEIEGTVVEIFWILGQKIQKNTQFHTDRQTSTDKEQNEKKQVLEDLKNRKKIFNDLLNKLLQQNIIKKNILLERLEEQQLHDCQLIEITQFNKKKNRINTKNSYEQHIFNLLREENEGFAKVFSELQDPNNITKKENIEITINNICHLIGYFDLDPNRVLDIILTVFEFESHNMNYIEIIKKFKISAIPQIIGQKFQQFSAHSLQLLPPEEGYALLQEKSTKLTPYSLYNLTARLIKEKVILLENMWQYLSPSNQDMDQFFIKRLEFTTRLIRRQVVTNLQKSEDLQRKEEEQIQKGEQEMNYQQLNNQKLWLAEALLRLNDFQHFELIFNLIGKEVDTNVHKPLQSCIQEYMHWLLEKVYEKLSPRTIFFKKKFQSAQSNIKKFEYKRDSPSEQLEQCNSIFDPNFFKQLNRVFRCVGNQLGVEPILFTKICRIATHFLSVTKNRAFLAESEIEIEHTSTVPLTEKQYFEILSYLHNIFGKYLLPAISYQNCNPGIVQEFWKVFQEFDHQARYFYYNQLVDSSEFVQNPHLVLRIAHSLKEIKQWGKFLTKDKIKQTSRSLGKISNNNPIWTFNEIIKTVKSYSNQISPTIGSLSYSTPLSLDVIMFMIIRQASDIQKEKLNTLDANYEQWLINLSQFTGQFLRKYYAVDLTGIFIYLCNRLQQGQIIDLIFFKEIIGKMSGCEFVESLSDEQLQALAGGSVLQMESTSLTQEFRSAKKSSLALEDFFWQKTLKFIQLQVQQIYDYDGAENQQPPKQEEKISIAFLLLVLLAQQKASFVYNTQFNSIKLIGIMQDQINDSLVQFLQFLKFQKDSSNHFAQLIPKNSFERMIKNYKIPHEIAFHIIRNGYKPLFKMTDEERRELVELFQKVYDEYDPDINLKNKEIKRGLTPNYFEVENRKNIWQHMTPQLFAYFWLLTLDDIYIPKQSYNLEIEKISNKLKEFDFTNAKNDKKVEKEIGRLKGVINKLKDEQKELENKFDKIKEFLTTNKEKIFLFLNPSQSQSAEVKKPQLSQQFVQVCIFPRLLIEPAEAIYCAKFVHMYHQIKKIGFKMVLDNVYYVLIMNILPSLQSCTEREAFNLSVFFQELFQPFVNWNDEKSLKEDIIGLTGNLDDFEHDRLKLQILTTHKKIIQVIQVYNSGGYRQCRNALLWLDRMKNILPSIQDHVQLLKQYAQQISKDNDQYEDLKLMADNYHQSLQQRSQKMPDIKLKDLKKKMDEIIKSKKKQNQGGSNFSRKEEGQVSIRGASNVQDSSNLKYSSQKTLGEDQEEKSKGLKRLSKEVTQQIQNSTSEKDKQNREKKEEKKEEKGEIKDKSMKKSTNDQKTKKDEYNVEQDKQKKVKLDDIAIKSQKLSEQFYKAQQESKKEDRNQLGSTRYNQREPSREKHPYKDYRENSDTSKNREKDYKDRKEPRERSRSNHRTGQLKSRK